MDATYAVNNFRLWKDYDDEQSEWITRNEKIRALSRGELYDRTNIQELKDNNLEEVGIPVAHTILKTLAGNLFSDMPGGAIVPIGNDEKSAALLIQALCDAAIHEARFKTTYARVIDDMLSCGIGIAGIDNAANPFGCTVNYYDPAWCRWPGGHQSLTWEDLDCFVMMKRMTVRQAIAMLGIPYHPNMDKSKLEEIASLPSEEYATYFSNERYQLRNSSKMPVEFREVMYSESITLDYIGYQKLLFYNEDKNSVAQSVTIPMEYRNEHPEGCPDDEALANVYSYYYYNVGNDELAKEYAKKQTELIKNGFGKIEPLKSKRAVKCVAVGGLDIGREVLPTMRIPRVPFIYELLGYPEGEMRHVAPMQRAINSSLISFMNNGQLLSNPWIDVIKGSVKDKSKYLDAVSTPYGLVEWEAVDPQNPELSRPQVHYPQPMGSYFVEFIQMMMSAAEMSSAAFGAFQGNPSSAPEANATNLTLNRQVSIRYMPVMINLQYAMCEIYSCLKDYVIDRMDEDVVVRIKETNDELLGMIAHDESAILEDRTKIGVKSSSPYYNMEIPVNKRVGQDIINNLKEVNRENYKVVVKTAPMSASIKERLIEGLDKLAHQAGNPAISAVAYKWRSKLEDNPLAEQIMKEFDMVNNLSAQVNEQGNIIQRLTQDVANAEKRATVSRISERASVAYNDFDAKLNKVASNLELLVKKLEVEQKAGNTEQVMAEADELKAKIDEASSDIQQTLEEDKDEAQQQISNLGETDNEPDPSNA